MAGGRSSNKNSGKLVRQLLFSEALLNAKVPPRPGGAAGCPAPHHDRLSSGVHHGPHLPGDLGGGSQTGWAGQCYCLIDCGNKIHPFGHWRLPVPCDGTATMGDNGRSPRRFLPGSGPGTPVSLQQMTELEDRSQRDNIRFLGLPENIEGVDIHSFLWEMLPKHNGITFDPPLEFQRAHRVGPKRSDEATHPRLIIACLRQLIQRARTQ
ncbi:hypothetical protein NDU88_005797 [Pleurodeles waltl]|uniref:Uncharacterized protein n=1 Tax=Pleurodeles waltl TaxID=8319 RepID=A0AAV7X2B0_PLEWA|nr:hypothetical protein NDU88_005797 [Pleurodeles waltl]